jgi:hypothetical protein
MIVARSLHLLARAALGAYPLEALVALGMPGRRNFGRGEVLVWADISNIYRTIGSGTIVGHLYYSSSHPIADLDMLVCPPS